MTEDPNTPTEDRVSERAARIAGGKTGSSAGKKAGIAAFVVLFLFFAAFMVAPQQVSSLFFGTSETEEFQSTSRTDTGLSTEFSRSNELDTGNSTEISTEMPETEEPVRTAQATDNGELAALQEQLDKLIAAQGQQGVDPAELEKLLDAQAERLQAEFERQRQLQDQIYQEQLRVARASAVPTGPTADELSEQERLQRLQEERARRAAINEEQVRSPALLYDEGEPGSAGSGNSGSGRDLNDNEAFLSAASRETHETVKAGAIADPSRTIVQGTIIEAVLETALSTELPGTLRAITSVDVYSYDGQNVLLPRGSRLIGTYSSDVSLAQRRALIAWNRAITPSGTSVALGGIGADQLGRSGQTGFVDTRFGQRFGSAALISVLGAAPAFLIDDDAGEAERELAEDISEDLRSNTNSVLEEYLSLPPIIYVDQGSELTVFVNRDIVF
ncbi:TrbI/VirB10 family protein [Phaeobacter inhibens]|uniref:TrbI/VirB10 family protein n=1 Tax=Phaeobacter inhibens TaxID=221822 RepID=UPI0026E14CCC|nr:TrbI/VirB10 family protein [Phaeobacter inhibens]MDO6758055.1 TrbI/VirB10 family protein [Phaeobacter inhibens]